jgi:hypothetical protein
MLAVALVVMIRRQFAIETQLVVVTAPSSASPSSACARSPSSSFDAGASYDSATAGIGAPAMELEEL